MIRVEFTVYPFIEGEMLPPYVQAAVDACSDAGLDVEVGPLSNILSGDAERVLDAMCAAQAAAVAAGAKRIVVDIEAGG